MENNITQDTRDVGDAVHLHPAISIIIPVKPKLRAENGLSHALKMIADKIEKQLYDTFSSNLAASVMQKLHRIIAQNNFETDKKSIAIYVSPVFEKVLYLDVEAEEVVAVNEPFEIRDLVYSKKPLNKYLVLLLNGNDTRLYLCNSNAYIKLALDVPEMVDAYVNDVPAKSAGLLDFADQKQTVINRFLHHIDDGLDAVLKTYKLPLFVVGTEKVLVQFKQLSRHNKIVIQHIHGNYNEDGIPELKNVLAPYEAALKKEKEQQLMMQLEEAQNRRTLAIGIKSVWREAMQHNGRLLVVEENYMYATQHGCNKNIINNNGEPPANQPIYIRDAVDEVIEEVLRNGGDIKFVEEGMLNKYQQIALILY